MPLALSKIRTVKFTTIIEVILYILENATEEKFWQGIFGERLTKLGQRYFGNDFIMLGILFYIAPILRTQWQNVVDVCLSKMAKRSKTVSVRVYYHDIVYNAINCYVMKHTGQIKTITEAVAMYEENPNSDSSDNEDELPVLGFYPRNNTTNEIDYNGHKVYVSSCSDDDEKTTSNRPNYLDISMETPEFGSIDTLKDILQEWCDEYNNKVDNTIKILRWDGYESWIYKDAIEPRGYESVNLPYGVKENLLADMEKFIKRRKWYQRKGLPHRRGFLLYGPPGTGKTSLIQALAGKLQFDLALIKLGEVLSDSDFSEMVRAVPKETLLIIEDVDHYDEKKGDMAVTKSGLLNGLDGINGNDGAMIFMTCNDINKLTPALLRPGRMDVKLELGYAVHEQLEAMFWRFFGTNDEDYDEDYDEDEKVEKNALTHQKQMELPPTPPNGDEDEKERRIYLEGSLKKLKAIIPENYVTTAELQNLFVTLFLEAETNAMDDKGLLENLFDRVPDFLERIKSDREQALKHDGKHKKKDDEDDSDNDNKKKKKDDEDDSDNDNKKTKKKNDDDDDSDCDNKKKKNDDDDDSDSDKKKTENDSDKKKDDADGDDKKKDGEDDPVKKEKKKKDEDEDQKKEVVKEIA